MTVPLSTEQREELRRQIEALPSHPLSPVGNSLLSRSAVNALPALLDALDAGPRSEAAGLDDIAASYEASARTWNRRAAESRGRTSEIAETRAQTWAAAAVDIRARAALRTTEETE